MYQFFLRCTSLVCRRYSLAIFLAVSSIGLASGFFPISVHAAEAKETDWLDLLPEDVKKEMLEMPELGHDEAGPPAELPAVMKSASIRKELDKAKIKIAGYIVPVEYDESGTVTEFFLVPYFGACIHVPPPPPNQIIYVTYEKGLQLESITEPFWISGTLSTQAKTNEMATSAYTMTAEAVLAYQY